MIDLVRQAMAIYDRELEVAEAALRVRLAELLEIDTPERGGSSGPQGIPAPAPSAAGDERPAEIDPASAGAEEPVAVPTAVIPPAPTSTNGHAREVGTPPATFRCSAPGCPRSFTSQTGLNIHVGHAHGPQSAQRAVPGPGVAGRPVRGAVTT